MSDVNSSQTAHLAGEADYAGKPYGLMLITAAFSAFLLYSLYQWALPKPIPGIPYDPRSIRGIFGDLPNLAGEFALTGDLSSWFHRRAAGFDSPVCQVFLRPLAPPVVLLSDFREAQDICMRRREFDRGSMMRDIFKGPTPNHQITMLTGEEWKSHRRLLQDLMSPPFLRDVAAPAIYTKLVNLVDLWDKKTRIADGRPFDASQDIFYAALDAVTAFCFGDDFPHNATKPVADHINGLNDDDIARLRGAASIDEAIEFTTVACDEVITATLDVSLNIERLHGSPFPVWKWKVISKLPPLNKTLRLKNQFIVAELKKAVDRKKQHGRDDTWMHSAVDLMLFGVITGGHDTTSTTMLWGLKFLADHPEYQAKLRRAMEDGFSAARAEKRNLRIEEIMHINVPYLYASMEEIMRCAGTAPFTEREAMSDTTLLGHHIPKGTKVFCLSQGASIKSPAHVIDESRRSETARLAAKNRGKVPQWDPVDIADFNPERWLVPVSPESEKGEPNGTGPSVEFDSAAGPQIPFGLGKRSCFGKRLACVELRIILSLIVWNFEILRCPEALSGYEAKDYVTHKPLKNYVRLRKVER
ncbi:Cytochrome P450 monooxygenase TRI13 [Colletotrichum spinosum]|uniref:Cytochrome P450 monooxygenase TRI13 n=1 Tax=Colletotrichum spinosum TaxID=1347390 RepID=A0A4R8QAZ1_9PEZI|nr:Cytochrome P450 monooxygenase TRI13 [Colletotrichum spinosum]